MFKIVDFNRKKRIREGDCFNSSTAITLHKNRLQRNFILTPKQQLSECVQPSLESARSSRSTLTLPAPPTCPLISAAPPLTRIRASIQSGIGGEHMMSRRVRAGERSSYFVSRGIVRASQQPFNRTIQSLLFELKRKVNIDVQNLKACHVYRREQELCLVSIHQHSDDRLNSREIPFNSFL